MPIPFIKTASGSISAFAQGRTVLVPPDHRFYQEILTAIRNDNADELVKLADLSESINKFIRHDDSGTETIKVEDGVVYYRGQEVHNTVTERIVEFMTKNLPYEPLVLFLENLLQNPSRHSVQQLYKFLENQNLPITEDGHFLAYKRISQDWKDLHTGTIDNSIGAEPTMTRNEVDDDYSQDCSYGLHVGAISYVRGFGSGGRIVLVKVNPRDAVAVPQYDCTKMRVCRYKVIEEIDPVGIGLSGALYSATNAVTPVAPTSAPVDDLEDEDHDNYEEDQWEEEEEEEEEEEYNDDGDWNEDDEDEANDYSSIPLAIRVWANSKDISLDYFLDNGSFQTTRRLLKAFEQKDGVSALQYLYAIAIEDDDSDSQRVLENPEDKRDFIDLVKNL